MRRHELNAYRIRKVKLDGFVDSVLVEVARGVGIHSIHHQGVETTCAALEALGLK